MSLTLGEPDFDTPASAAEAAIQAIREGDTHYPPVAGQAPLREAVAEWFRTRNRLRCTAENVLVSTGAKQSLMNILWALLNPGDEALLLAPYWVSYRPMVQMAGGISVVLPPTDSASLKVSASAIAEAITPRTRVLILNSPGNPSGAVYTPDEVRSIAAALAGHPQITVIADEIYSQILYGAEHLSIGSLPELEGRVVTINGVSKAYAMTGWRIGFACGPLEVIRAAETLQGQVTSGACSISQRAALAAVTGDPSVTEAMVAAFRNRRDYFVPALLAAAPRLRLSLPPGAFYVYPDCSGYFGCKSSSGAVLQTATDFTEFLLQEAGVCGVPGEAFGTGEHIRFSYACSSAELQQAVAAIGTAIETLR